MFKKLRNKAVISFCIFLLLVVGGTSLTYYLFAEDLYVAKKDVYKRQNRKLLKLVCLT